MQYDVYKDLYIKDGYSVFEFLSVGRRGVIAKRIIFAPTDFPDIYNMTYGDIDINNEINDLTISDNGDRNKILATLAYVIEEYLEKYPDRIIFFTGSTYGRTRLYRMAISINIEYLSSKFNIHCQTDNGIIEFEEHTQITGFLISKKV